MDNKKSVGIIGSGLAGLSASIRLANYGFNVEVFEKNDFYGGKASSININGFRFDFGPSLLTMPFILIELFKSVNEDINEYLKLEELNITCKYFYDTGSILNFYQNKTALKNELKSKFKIEEEQFEKYYKYIKNIYELTSQIFLYNDFRDPKIWFSKSALLSLLNIQKLDTNSTVHRSNKIYFNNKEIVQLFDRYATYNGSNPYVCPATLNIIPFVEMEFGGYLPFGGIESITNALIKLAKKKGVILHNNSDVKEIVIENNKAKSIKYNNEIRNFDIIISNCDVYYTYTELLKKDLPKRIIKNEPSSSALIFYLGVKGESENLETHNILFSKNYKNEFDSLFNKREIYEDPTIYIYISKKICSNDAPDGCENWYVMINAPYTIEEYSKQKVQEIKANIINKIKNLLNIDLTDKILFEKCITPSDIDNITRSKFGSIYGTSSNSKFSAFLRHPNYHPKIQNLFFCGGSYHPGGGIPLVLLSGKLVFDKIVKKANK